jgi:DNA-binding CsgD family transcriptional regulator
LVDPVDARLPDENRMVAQFADEHPVYAHYRRTSDRSAHAISDFGSRVQWRRSALYNEMYRPRTIEEQMTFMLRTRPPTAIGVQLNRGRRGFAEHERLALDLFRPHLIEVYRTLDATARTRQALAEARSALDLLDCGAVVIDGHGHIGLANKRAWRAFATYFCDRPRRADALPDTIERWLRVEQHRAPRDVAHPNMPLVIERGGRQLIVRLLKDHAQSLLLLDERQEIIDPALLASLALTPRETEVLVWIARGKTDAEIGIILESRPKTVGKHLERIYRKIGVETRTAAAARAFETASLFRR